MLSYSTGGSSSGADVDKVRAATELVRTRAPDLRGRGTDPVRRRRRHGRRGRQAQGLPCRRSRHGAGLPRPQRRQQHVQGGPAQRRRDRGRAGPPGARRPVNDLSRGALVPDIVFTVAITAIQAEGTS